jgi:hypothetical protein
MVSIDHSKRILFLAIYYFLGEFRLEKLKVIKAKSWDELPEILKPGIYNVNGDVHIIEEEVPKEVIIRALKYKEKGKTLI